jgi:hypothetical protein
VICITFFDVGLLNNRARSNGGRQRFCALVCRIAVMAALAGEVKDFSKGFTF